MARPRASSVGAAPEARLLRLVADLTRRFASLLAGAAGPKGPLADAVTFLVSCAEQTAAASESAAGEGEATHPVAGPVPGSIAPIDRLSLALGLAPFELDLALLAGLPEEHEGFADVLRGLHPRGEPRATAALASQLLCADGAQRRLVRQALVAGTPARSGLVRLVEDAPYPERNLVLAEALWPVLQGLDAWPSSVGVDAPPAPAIGLDGWLAAPEVRRARRALELGQPVTLLVLADHDDVGIHRASALVDSVGVPSVRLRLGPDPSHEAERLAQLHAIARGAIPVVRFALPDGPAGSVEAPTFAEFPGPVVLVLRNGTPIAHVRRPLLPLPAELLRPGDRARMWRTVLPELSSEAPSLASRLALEPGLAAEVALDARAAAALDERPLALADVAASARVRSTVALSSGVKIVRPSARWEQLVLRPERRAQLREAVDRLLGQVRVLDEWRFLEGRAGARGVRMLFAGPPGTGKTLSAEVLAATLGVDLLVVDISRVVSKWIGETEKNLAQVFGAAERSTAVLLFDEADALFGKRTEVSDAHDRYANLETAYLLSRLERFEGMAILSTNLRDNIDPAFLRRLEFVIDFDEPEMAERETLWRAHVPPSAPLADGVDFRELAKLYPVVGGLIRNAAVAAAFLAAAEGQPVSQHHFVRSMKREYEKSGRAFPGIPPRLASATRH